MILDCFTFFNEFDVLELRLRTLEDVVDRFVLCEAPFTFRGTPKPLFFAHAGERFARWRDRITVLTYDAPPSADPWLNEWGQRDFLAAGLRDCAPDDLVLLGDCDEIPDPRFVGVRPAPGRILGHRMLLALGYVNRLFTPEPYWMGTRAATVGTYERLGGLSAVRRMDPASLEVIDSGWHFTSLGGAAVFEEKMQAYSHAEYDIPYLRDRRRLDVWFAANAAMWVPLDERFPAVLRGDERWRPFVWPRPAADDLDASRRLQHAHGCFAYVSADAAAVAVLTPEPGAWTEAGTERFRERFAGAFGEVATLLGSTDRPFVVIDGMNRWRPGLLRPLAEAGLELAVYGRNARRLDVFVAALAGYGAVSARPRARACRVRRGDPCGRVRRHRHGPRLYLRTRPDDVAVDERRRRALHPLSAHRSRRSA